MKSLSYSVQPGILVLPIGSGYHFKLCGICLAAFLNIKVYIHIEPLYGLYQVEIEGVITQK